MENNDTFLKSLVLQFFNIKNKHLLSFLLKVTYSQNINWKQTEKESLLYHSYYWDNEKTFPNAKNNSFPQYRPENNHLFSKNTYSLYSHTLYHIIYSMPVLLLGT